MKGSEAFKKAQISVLNDPDMLIKQKLEVLEALLWEEYFAKITEDHKPKEESKNGESV
jgi:hypothetical protein